MTTAAAAPRGTTPNRFEFCVQTKMPSGQWVQDSAVLTDLATLGFKMMAHRDRGTNPDALRAAYRPTGSYEWNPLQDIVERAVAATKIALGLMKEPTKADVALDA